MNTGPRGWGMDARVGIGTTDPQALLDVNGTIKGNSTIYLGSSSMPGCIVMGDISGGTTTYVTADAGVLSASTTKPAACQ